MNNPDNKLADQIEKLIVSLHASSRLLIPDTQDQLLRSIVETAARIFGAAAASIALVDESSSTLVFKVAFGAGNEALEGLHIPMDNGIAGYVAMTGQPIAVSDVSHDPRFNLSFAESTGYVPRSILACPLLSEERVIGVMEVLDKIEAPNFTLQEMELLGLFARQAAIAISQSQQVEMYGEVFLQCLKNTLMADPTSNSTEFLAVIEESQRLAAENSDLSRAVELLTQIQAFGEAERHTSIQVLGSLLEYWQSQKRYIR